MLELWGSYKAIRVKYQAKVFGAVEDECLASGCSHYVMGDSRQERREGLKIQRHRRSGRSSEKQTIYRRHPGGARGGRSLSASAFDFISRHYGTIPAIVGICIST